jgi:hypothetical protein
MDLPMETRMLRFAIQDRAAHLVGRVIRPREHPDWILALDGAMANTGNPRMIRAVRVALEMVSYADLLVEAADAAYASDADDPADATDPADKDHPQLSKCIEALLGMESDFLLLYSPYLLDTRVDYPPPNWAPFNGTLDKEAIRRLCPELFFTLPTATTLMIQSLLYFHTYLSEDDVPLVETEEWPM